MAKILISISLNRKGMVIKMKTSVSLSVFPRKENAPVIFSMGTDENIKTIKDLGYEGVDLFVKDPTERDTKEVIGKLHENDLGIGVIMPAALAGQGLFLGDRDSEIRNECIRRIGEIILLAADNGGMVSLGLVRGNRYPDETLERFYERFTDSSEKLLEIAEKVHVPLLIEPINRYEINTINSVAEGAAYIKTSGLPLYLMVDTFHMNIEDVSVERSFTDAFPLIKHVHFLDSNRLAPSMGHLNMEKYYRILEEMGYEGYLCLEALPKPDPYTCAKTGSEFFKAMKGAAK